MIEYQINEGRVDIDLNFWELNPQFKYYQPFSDLYDRDETENSSYSSKEMWLIILIQHPDQKISIFSEMSFREKIKMLKKTYGENTNMEDEVFKNCIDSFPDSCLTIEEKNYYVEKQTMVNRTILFQETTWTLDITDKTTGRIIKGTAIQLNTLQKDYERIHLAYEKVKSKFIDAKTQIRKKGGGRISKGQTSGFF